MPKKTRQEKILARLRRLEKDQSPSNSETQSLPEAQPPKVSFQFNSESNTTINPTTKPTAFDYSYVFKDLRKSLIFATLAIIFQIALALFIIK